VIWMICLEIYQRVRREIRSKMDEIDIMNKALAEYEYARRLKRINQELYDHLIGSVYYLIKQSEKYNTPLPNRDILLQMIKNTGFIIDQFAKPIHHPKLNTEKNSNEHPEDEQN
jgi:hypothetical protein